MNLVKDIVCGLAGGTIFLWIGSELACVSNDFLYIGFLLGILIGLFISANYLIVEDEED